MTRLHSIAICDFINRKMENPTFDDTLPAGPMEGAQLHGPGVPPPQSQQLPPQMFTTAAQLLDLTDSKRP
jgi:hypothetical protein